MARKKETREKERERGERERERDRCLREEDPRDEKDESFMIRNVFGNLLGCDCYDVRFVRGYRAITIS